MMRFYQKHLEEAGPGSVAAYSRRLLRKHVAPLGRNLFRGSRKREVLHSVPTINALYALKSGARGLVVSNLSDFQ